MVPLHKILRVPWCVFVSKKQITQKALIMLFNFDSLFILG